MTRRRYEARRVEASNAMMALLAGAGMASHLLQLTRGSNQWADMLIADLIASDANLLGASNFRRRARGLAKFHYAPLQLSDDDLDEGRYRYLGR